MKKLLPIRFVFGIIALLIVYPSAHATKHIITQQNTSFNPSALTGVVLGDTIRFVWTSGFHTTTSTNIPAGADAWDQLLTSGTPFYEYVPAKTGLYHYKCTPHELMGMIGTFEVILGGSTLTGTVQYANNASTGMAGTTVKLYDDQGNVVDVANTNATGHYTFSSVSAGNYTLNASTAIPWGGVNSTDALAALRHFVHIITLTGMRYKAADVDNVNNINSLDALLITKRFVGLLNAFPNPDWYIPTVSVTVGSSGTVNQNISAICMGDADGSYSATTAFVGDGPQTLPPLANEMMTFSPGNELDIPLKLQSNVPTGAISLVLAYPEDKLSIISVSSPSLGGNLCYHAENGILKIGWFSLNAVCLAKNQNYFIIHIKTHADISPNQEFGFNLLQGSEIADVSAQIIPDAGVMLPKLKAVSSAIKHQIVQQGFTFVPNSLTGVHIGDTIHFQWTSGFHTTTSTNIPVGAAGWDQILSSNSTYYDYLVTEEGTYQYQCTPHASMGMTGSFTVSSVATGINNDLTTTIDFNLYPNPASDEVILNLTMENPEAARVRILTPDGQIMRTYGISLKSGVQTIPVDIYGLAPGMYFVEIKTQNHSFQTQRMIVL